MKKSIIVGAILGLIVLLYGAGYLYLYSFVPNRTGEEKLQGLSAEVNVYYDDTGVPHIEAQNREDAFRALGYVHAKDRLFQMVMIRRVALGKLAEILGPDLVEIDKFFRTLGLDQFSREYVEKSDPNAPYIVLSRAYLEGVNAYIESGELPVEFTLLGFKPEKFKLEDSVAIAGYMAYTFASALKQEPLLEHIRTELGDAYLADLDYEMHPTGDLDRSRFDYSNKASLRPDQEAGRRMALRQIMDLTRRIDDVRQPFGIMEGSNAWAVAPKRSNSGQAMLAGDPHISFSQPQVWFEVHVKAPDLEFYGHMLAAIPFPLLAHDRGKAWSLTMFQNDDMDLYAESLNPQNPGQTLFRGQGEDIQKRNVVIKVKGSEDIQYTVRSTRHGPILNDVVDEIKDKPPISMKWAFIDLDNKILDAFYTMLVAANVNEFEQGVSKIGAPGLNVMYADSAGNIAWWAAAKLPIRAPGTDPSFLLDGTGSQEWTGFKPFSQNPQDKNPESGYLFSANEQPRKNAPPGYYNFPGRAYRLHQYLESQEYVSLDEMKELQGDISFDYGVDQIKTLSSIIGKDIPNETTSKTAWAYLKQWNGQFDSENVGGSIFMEFLFQIAQNAIKDDLKEDYFDSFTEARFYYEAMGTLIANPDSPYWDDRNTPEKETRKQIILKAWNDALAVLEDQLGGNPGNWVWRRLHTVEYVHPIGRKWPFNMLFNVGPFPAVGSTETVFNLYHGQNSGQHKVTLGPSTRRIIDFADPTRSLGITPTGNSGVVLDPHYSDQAQTYLKRKYRDQIMDIGAIKADHDPLRLVP